MHVSEKNWLFNAYHQNANITLLFVCLCYLKETPFTLIDTLNFQNIHEPEKSLIPSLISHVILGEQKLEIRTFIQLGSLFMYVFIYYIYCPLKIGVFANTPALVVVILKKKKKREERKRISKKIVLPTKKIYQSIASYFSPIVRHMQDSNTTSHHREKLLSEIPAI